MELINKIIYYDNYMYKVVNFQNKKYCIHKLIKNNELFIEFDEYKNVHNFKDIKLIHFEDNIEPKQKIIKELKNYVILDDITNYYLCNGLLMNGYIQKWSNVVNAWNFEAEYNIKFYISLLTNGKFKKYYEEDRNNELYIFCLLMCDAKPRITGGLSYLQIIENLGYDKIFYTLKKEAIQNEMKKFELVKNDICPMCLSTDIENYKGLYKCSHHACYECYMNWSNRTCPLCRAENNYY